MHALLPSSPLEKVQKSNANVVNKSAQPSNESLSLDKRVKESTSTASVAANTVALSVPFGASPVLDIASTDVQLLAIVGTTGDKKTVLNDLFAWINSYRQKSTDEAVQKVVVEYSSQDDDTTTKWLLGQDFVC